MDTLPPPLEVEPVGSRDSHWTVPDDGLVSRRARARGTGFYRAAVSAPLRAQHLDLPSDLAADAAEAESALVALDRQVSVSLGGSSLGPMSMILLRTESSASSRIENLTVGARQLALAELQESTSTNAQSVAANVRAMDAALSLALHLDLSTVLAMHRALLATDQLHARYAGRLRERPVWIGRSDQSPLGATFVPPLPEDVPAAMDDLVAFMTRDDLPILVHAALAHAQFETIHPFTDGNGRTGRAIVHAMLHGAGVLRTLTPPISAGLLRDLDGYFTALTAFRQGDARPIVERFAESARYAATSGARLIDDLLEELDHSRQRMRSLRPQAVGWRLLPVLVGQPVVNAAYVGRALACAPTTAHRAISQLEQAGVLLESTRRSRGRVWHHPGILDALDAYAEHVRR